MADIFALAYAENDASPLPAITALQASRQCRKIWLAGFGNEQLPKGCFPDLEVCENLQTAAQRIAESAPSDALLLLVSSLTVFSGNTLQRLVENLEADAAVAGVNPVFTTYDGEFISHLGTVADCLGYLHYLYEGLPCGNPLAMKTRNFQIGHPAFLLVRIRDLRKQGAFWEDDLGFIGFCKNLVGIRSCGFATVPQAKAAYENKSRQLQLLGVINSLTMRGRLRPGTFISDYPDKVRADNLEYGVNEWLQEGPANVELYDSGNAWFCWRNAGTPETLLGWLASERPEEAGAYVNLVREFPCYLPAQFHWYEVLAGYRLASAEKAGLELMAAQIRAWQKRARSFHYGPLRKGMKLLNTAGMYNRSLDRCPAVYDAWLELSPEAMPARMEIGRDWSKIAVAMPVYNPNLSFFRQAVESVRRQYYHNWQLCMADDASTDPEIRPMLEALANEDGRINVVFRAENGHISRATNSALELVDAPWTAFMDNDDLLAPDALAEVAKAAAARPNLKYIFSDFDKIDASNVRRTPFFRPGHDFERNFVAHLSCYDTSLLKELGGLKAGYEGSQDYDLNLRALERIGSAEIYHVARILYHWRVHQESTAGAIHAKPYVIESALKARRDCLLRNSIKGNVERHAHKNIYWIREEDAGTSSWAILIGGGRSCPDPIRDCRFAPLAQKGRAAFYWLPDSDCLPEVTAPERSTGIATLPLPEPGMRGIMRAAASIPEQVILVIAACLRPLQGCEPEQLLMQAQRPDLSAVGSLIFRNGLLDNGGFYPDVDGKLFPLLRGTLSEDLINFCWGLFAMPHPAIAPSPLCFAMRRENIQDFVAKDSSGPYALAEYCLEAAANGKRTLISPWGSWQIASEPPHEAVSEEGKRKFMEKWGETIKKSGLRNPNLRAAQDNDWTLILPD